MTTRELVVRALDHLPDDATVDDVIEEIAFINLLNRRIQWADDGPSYTQAEVEQWMAEWQD